MSRSDLYSEAVKDRRLPAANLTERVFGPGGDKSGFEEIADGYARKAVLRVARLKPDEVGLGDLNFRSVLNQENPLFLGYESAEDIQGRGFPRAGARQIKMFLRERT